AESRELRRFPTGSIVFTCTGMNAEYAHHRMVQELARLRAFSSLSCVGSQLLSKYRTASEPQRSRSMGRCPQPPRLTSGRRHEDLMEDRAGLRGDAVSDRHGR